VTNSEVTGALGLKESGTTNPVSNREPASTLFAFEVPAKRSLLVRTHEVTGVLQEFAAEAR
jgi:hypothetical protein